jgi:hypothetical protein
MTGLPKIMVVAGAILLILGFLMAFTKLGRLPGDIIIKKENSTFYFPVMTSIIASVVLSLIFYIIGRFK